ncbi:MAG TPA: V-type ATP synthase subunit E family protein [Candidatus Methanomethylophilaceae archaeon]|nr:V-type ATP synthase subunit E family protein [Candidatus Methanomethylophilaceae archaeon]
MALENVTKEIQADADAKVKSIQDSAKAEIDKICADANASISDMKELEDRKLKSEIERLDRQVTSSSELESKNLVLAKKKEILARTFDEVLTEMESSSKADKLKRYKSLIKEAEALIPGPIVVISDEHNFSAEELGVESVEKDGRIKAGLILRSKDGSAEVDLQYRTLLTDIWDSNLKALSDILFG